MTGAARGMGAAHARRLVEEGAKVVLTDVMDKEGGATVKSMGSNARYYHQDEEAQWQHVIAETKKVYGPVSVLVNNAGIVAFSPIENMEGVDYRRVIDVNQVAVFSA